MKIDAIANELGKEIEIGKEEKQFEDIMLRRNNKWYSDIFVSEVTNFFDELA